MARIRGLGLSARDSSGNEDLILVIPKALVPFNRYNYLQERILRE